MLKEREEIKAVADMLLKNSRIYSKYESGSDDNLAYRYNVFTLKILYQLIWNTTIDLEKRNLYFQILYRLLHPFYRRIGMVDRKYLKYLDNMSSTIYSLIVAIENIMINAKEPLYQEAVKLFKEDVDFINRLRDDIHKLSPDTDDICWLSFYELKNGPVIASQTSHIKLTNMMLRLYLGERFQDELGVMLNIRQSCKSTDEQIQNMHNPTISLHEFKKILYNTYNMYYQQLMDKIDSEEIVKYDSKGNIKDTIIDMINTNSFVNDTGVLPVADLSMYKFEETPYGRIIEFKHRHISTTYNLLFR